MADDTPMRGAIRDVLYETRRLDGPTIWDTAIAIEAAIRNIRMTADSLSNIGDKVPEYLPHRQIVVPFGNLLAACRKRGMRARLYIFDGGETVEVSQDSDGAQVLRVTAEHGDPFTAPEVAAKELMERGLLSMFDFEFGE